MPGPKKISRQGAIRQDDTPELHALDLEKRAAFRKAPSDPDGMPPGDDPAVPPAFNEQDSARKMPSGAKRGRTDNRIESTPNSRSARGIGQNPRHRVLRLPLRYPGDDTGQSQKPRRMQMPENRLLNLIQPAANMR